MSNIQVIYDIRSDVESGERVPEEKKLQFIEEIVGVKSGARCRANKSKQSSKY